MKTEEVLCIQIVAELPVVMFSSQEFCNLTPYTDTLVHLRDV